MSGEQAMACRGCLRFTYLGRVVVDGLIVPGPAAQLLWFLERHRWHPVALVTPEQGRELGIGLVPGWQQEDRAWP